MHSLEQSLNTLRTWQKAERRANSSLALFDRMTRERAAIYVQCHSMTRCVTLPVCWQKPTLNNYTPPRPLRNFTDHVRADANINGTLSRCWRDKETPLKTFCQNSRALPYIVFCSSVYKPIMTWYNGQIKQRGFKKMDSSSKHTQGTYIVQSSCTVKGKFQNSFFALLTSVKIVQNHFCTILYFSEVE